MLNTSQLQRGRKVWGAWGFQVHGRASAPVVFSGEGDFESWGRGGDIGSRQRARPARRADKEAPTNRGSGGQQCRPPGEEDAVAIDPFEGAMCYCAVLAPWLGSVSTYG